MYKKIEPKITEPDVLLYSDIVYSNQFSSFMQDNIPLKLHLLRPSYNLRSWEKLPLVVWVSGGGFRGCSPARNLPMLMNFAKQGYVVASVQYRVSSEAVFPAQIQDVKTAIRFLKHYHEKFGIDPERVVIAGHSAGAYLTSIVAATEGVKMFETEEWNDISSAVKGAVCVAGGDFMGKEELMEASERKTPALKLFLDNDANDCPEKAAAAGVMQYVNKNTPPYLLIHGEKDPLLPSTIAHAFYEDLVNAGVDVDFYEIAGAGHEPLALLQPDMQQVVLEFLNKTTGNSDK